ncbi:MAG: energy transducer TonB [Pseudomonadota bacterium]
MLTALPFPTLAQPDYEEPYAIEAPTPPMPLSARESGYCCVNFDVDADGSVNNATVGYCTLELFRNASVWSVKQWEYEPARRFGRPVAETGLTEFVSFILAYEDNGEIIPSHTGYLTPKGKNPPEAPRPKDKDEHTLWLDQHYDTEKLCVARIS